MRMITRALHESILPPFPLRHSRTALQSLVWRLDNPRKAGSGRDQDAIFLTQPTHGNCWLCNYDGDHLDIHIRPAVDPHTVYLELNQFRLRSSIGVQIYIAHTYKHKFLISTFVDLRMNCDCSEMFQRRVWLRGFAPENVALMIKLQGARTWVDIFKVITCYCPHIESQHMATHTISRPLGLILQKKNARRQL